MSQPFSPRLQELALRVGREQRLPVRQGVLVAVSGPNFETMAELRMLRRAGADAIGMSVVPEVIVAKHAGIPEVLGISCITDMATGEAATPVSHDHVLAAARKAEGAFCALVEGVLERL
jgi:purine-nucleoside phosphorylase